MLTSGDDGDWPTDERNACLGIPDRVGVRLVGTYKWLTGLVGTGNLTMTAENIQQLEPTNC